MKGITLDTPLIRLAGRFLSRFGAYIWISLVLGFTIWFGWRNQAEIQNIWRSLRAADPIGLGGAAAIAGDAAPVEFHARKSGPRLLRWGGGAALAAAARTG